MQRVLYLVSTAMLLIALNPVAFAAVNGASIQNVNDLQTHFTSVYTNNANAILYPIDSDAFFDISLGVISFAPTNFNNWLTNGWPGMNLTDDIVGYPVFFEENIVSQERVRTLFGLNEHLLMVWTNNWNATNWIISVYGSIPYWENAEQWLALRDPSRLHYSITLLSPDDYAAWVEINTPTAIVPVVTSGIPEAYSNNLYLKVDYTRNRSVWLYTPVTHTNADIFSAEDLKSPDWLLNNTLYSPDTYAQVFFNDSTDREYLQAADADIDIDGDGLSDAREKRLYETRPDLADTDNDGLLDGEEIMTYGLNALNPDSDGDGLPDGIEVLSGTGLNPKSFDTNGDGVSDGDEDSDGDGLTNNEELTLGSDLSNSSDALSMLQNAKAKAVCHWNMIYPEPLVFSNTPGSSEDLQQLYHVMSILCNHFYSVEEK